MLPWRFRRYPTPEICGAGRRRFAWSTAFMFLIRRQLLCKGASSKLCLAMCPNLVILALRLGAKHPASLDTPPTSRGVAQLLGKTLSPDLVVTMVARAGASGATWIVGPEPRIY